MIIKSEKDLSEKTESSSTPAKDEKERIIKKYPNRRLYDTKNSSYITLEEVRELILENQYVKIIDSKTHEDITSSILFQIILELETGGSIPLFSAEVLAIIIRFYGQTSQNLFSSFLDSSIRSFERLQSTLLDTSVPFNNDTPMDQALWSKFVALQKTNTQKMADTYVKNSFDFIRQMQQQMNNQSFTPNTLGDSFTSQMDKKPPPSDDQEEQ